MFVNDPAEITGATASAEPGANAAGSLALERTGDRIGRYKLLQVLGEGGFGVVYLAEQDEPVLRRVALKVIKLGMDTHQVIARFEAERQALAMMDHPNIAKVLDAGQTETGRPYFVMELVRGIPVTAFCNKERLSPKARLELFIQVCHAIQHAHQKGIIHRDIKPSNVLVAFQDGVPVPKVIDFGIAKATAGRLTDKTLFTMAEQLIGTPAYMSPEQAEMSNVDIDTRSDIYSLGVLLYELMTGSTPFEAGKLLSSGFDEFRRRIREEEPPRPSTRLHTLGADELAVTAARYQTDPAKLVSALRGDMDWIVMRCLEKDRTRRYETANGLAMDLRRFLVNEPVLARPPSRTYQLRKMIRRNQGAFAAVSMIFLALAIGLGAAVFGLARAREERANALKAASAEAAERLRAQGAETAATAAAQFAKDQKEMADRSAEESRRRLIRSQLSNGTRLMEENDYSKALTWLVAALGAGQGRPTEEAHRLRIAGVLRHSPALLQMWFHEGAVSQSAFSPDGLRVAVASRDRTVHLWSARTGEALTPPLYHEGEVLSVAFHPAGRLLLTACADGTARVWDSMTAKLFFEPMRHAGLVKKAVYDPEGKRIATASNDGTARIWNAEDGAPLTDPLRHNGFVWLASFSPDGRDLITGSEDGTAQLWDSATGVPRLAPLRHGGPVKAAAFSPDGLRLVTASFDGSSRLWDAKTGEMVGRSDHGGGLDWCGFSPDGTKFATVSHAMTARIWDGRTGAPITPPLLHRHGVSIAAFSRDGRMLMTGSWDQTVRAWNTIDGSEILPAIRHVQQLSHLCFSPDGSRLLTSGQDGVVQLWDLNVDKRLRLTVQASEGRSIHHYSRIERPTLLGQMPPRPMEAVHAEFSPDGNRFLSVAEDGTARIWNRADGKPVMPPLRHGGRLLAGAYSPNGRWIGTGGSDSTAKIWSAETGSLAAPVLVHEGSVLSVMFSPDSERILTASADGSARIWETRTGKLLARLRHRQEVHRAVFDRAGERVATASSDQTARIWNAATGEPLSEPLVHPAEVWDVDFSPDGQRIVAACSDRTDNAREARVWDAASGKPLLSLKHGDGVSRALFNTAGTRVLTASEDSTARLWAADTGEMIGLLHSRYVVENGAFSPDDRWAATVSGDGFLRLWDAETAEMLGPPMGPWGTARSVRFSPDLRQLLSASSDGRVYLWDLPREERTYSNLVVLAELLSKERLHGGGRVQPLETMSLRARWVEWSGRAQQILETPQSPPVIFSREAIPPRPPATPPELIDLSKHYNALLNESWHGNVGNDLGEFAPGIREFGGVNFDARGIIQLRCRVIDTNLYSRFAEAVRGIEVNRNARRIHLLHSTGWGNGPDGTPVAGVVLSYADGGQSRFDLRLGEHLRDWHFNPRGRAETRNSKAVWDGTNQESRNAGNRVQVFLTSFDNPHPDKRIAAFDFESAMGEPGLFVLAVTVEP